MYECKGCYSDENLKKRDIRYLRSNNVLDCRLTVIWVLDVI